jgi:hypothetical protein
MRHVWAAITAATAIIQTAPAVACQLDDPVEIISGAISNRGEIRAVALARVAEAELIPVPPASSRGFPANWRASFDVERFLRGNAQARRFERQQRGGPGTCDFASAPKVGDLRVLYIFDNDVVYDVDLDMAPRVETELSKQLPPKARD